MTPSKFVFLLAVLATVSLAAPTPIVLLHGIKATNQTMAHVADLLRQTIPGVYVHNAEIGKGDVDSFWPMTKQIDYLCKDLAADPHLQGGFNVFTVSQGGLVTRGYVERCNSPPVRNIAFWVSPQAGVSGVPMVEPWCDQVFHNSSLCYALDHVFDAVVYTKEVQRPAGRPGQPARGQEPQYRANMLALHDIVMVHSDIDKVLVPRESSSWVQYGPDGKTLVPLQQTEMYKQDWIGLRTLEESGRLRFATVSIPHDDYYSPAFDGLFTKHALPVLMKN
ncbi:putative palmitoyl protein thioesterase [Paratrimastix pyriformis]|uniref:Palmitoyl protein thioesterase n=1 Tax=Paratrimastix pyriformis TaxID=342808 RepID=A0ABQ8ULJ3_9EUKA|nr:putative palmitoyl protein thioesterase [Paratrimastix pyriformis]